MPQFWPNIVKMDPGDVKLQNLVVLPPFKIKFHSRSQKPSRPPQTCPGYPSTNADENINTHFLSQKTCCIPRPACPLNIHNENINSRSMQRGEMRGYLL